MRTKIKINASITDFAPLLKGPEFLFKGLAETGVDGIELVMGVKSRWSARYFKSLSEKYNLPIVSLHQPIWSGLGWYFDEGFLAFAKELDIKYITFHPLPGMSLQDKKMKSYLNRLVAMQKKYDLTICLENLPKDYSIKLFSKLFPTSLNTNNVLAINEAAQKYGLKMTLDIDHLRIPDPHNQSWFSKVLPNIGNIHLSSYTSTAEHLPLYLGEFESKEFVNSLMKHKYAGLLTFEIYYPGLINVTNYDFEAIKKSVKFLKQI